MGNAVGFCPKIVTVRVKPARGCSTWRILVHPSPRALTPDPVCPTFGNGGGGVRGGTSPRSSPFARYRFSLSLLFRCLLLCIRNMTYSDYTDRTRFSRHMLNFIHVCHVTTRGNCRAAVLQQYSNPQRLHTVTYPQLYNCTVSDAECAERFAYLVMHLSHPEASDGESRDVYFPLGVLFFPWVR